jgi:hypothetical protein
MGGASGGMPYIEKKVKGGFAVKNSKTGHVTAKHTTKAKADAQKRLLSYLATKKT